MANIEADLRMMNRQLKKLDEKVRNQVMNKANRAGLKIAVDLARQTAKSRFKGKGYMASQIAQARGKGGPYKIVNRMGVKGGAKKPKEKGAAAEFLFGKAPKKGAAYYWRFLEFGTSKMPARPFLRVGFEGSRFLMFSVVKKEIKKGIEREARRVARRSRR